MKEEDQVARVVRDINTLRESVSLAYKEAAHETEGLRLLALKTEISSLFSEMRQLWLSIGDGEEIPITQSPFERSLSEAP